MPITDCLHCDINELVQQHMAAGTNELADLAAMIAESLVDLILLAPEADQPKLMADALGHFGQVFLEKSGAVEPEASSARH